MQFVFAPILGSLSDRYGRRPVLLFSLLGFGLDYIFLAFAPSIGWLFLGRMISGITGASITTASAYMADISNEKNINGFTKVLLTDIDGINIESNLLKNHLSKWFPQNKISEFINLLNNKFVITGSSILKMIYSFKSESSDLDLAISEDVDIEDLLHLLHNTGFEKHRSYYSNISNDSKNINNYSLNKPIKENHQYFKVGENHQYFKVGENHQYFKVGEKHRSYYSNIPNDSEYINNYSLNKPIKENHQYFKDGEKHSHYGYINNMSLNKQPIKEIHQYFKDGKKIDIIIVNKKPSDYIKSFDLKIVMNYFDGKNFYLLYPENVIYKKENLNYIPIDFKRYIRIEKYLHRGFDISIFGMDIKNINLDKYGDGIEIKKKIAVLLIENIIYKNKKEKNLKKIY
jgi:hypothetical protein